MVEDSRNGCVSGITAGCHVFAVPDIVPLPQDVADGCEAVLDTLFDLGGGNQGCALENCGVETSDCSRCAQAKEGPGNGRAPFA